MKNIQHVILLTLFACCGCFAPTASSSNQPIVPDSPAKVESDPLPAVEPDKKTPEPPPVKAGPPVVMTFEDLDIGMEPDSVFEDWMLTLKVKAKLNQRVRITGFMCGAILQSRNIAEIPLLREKECPYGLGGQAHHVVQLHMRATDLLEFTVQPITVEGNLTLKPFTGPNGKTWSLYDLDDAVRVD